MENTTEAVLASIRKIIRASDLYSSQMRRSSGLTSPQLLLLRATCNLPVATLGELAEHISLSQATTTTVIDRLEKMGLVTRYRSDQDRRKVHIKLTAAGEDILLSAPQPMQLLFVEQFEHLKTFEQSAILSCLQHVAEMMQQSPEQISDPAIDTAA